MKIRPRNIPKFQNGGVPQWYLDRYGNRTSLLNWNLNKRYNYSNLNLNTNDHRNAGNLDTVYNKNMAYIGTPGAISSDIQAFYDSDGNGMSALDFVNFYNQNAAKIRNHWALDLTYNAKTAGDHNRLFKRMFLSRSNLSMSPGSSYNIGYLDNLENIEGSSTWLRRMDLYEKEFDLNNPDSNRIHEINLKDGSKARVYKKANGDIALLNGDNTGIGPILPSLVLGNKDLNSFKPKLKDPLNSVIAQLKFDKEPFINKLQAGFNKIAPDLLDVLRLAGNMHNNERVYNESMKAIIPNLQLSFHTYRQVVGDEATKLGYYRRAAQGQSQAAKPFTSDADRQIAYLMEAKRIGDELRAQGDLADNQRIRETSAESAAHADANIERDTAVANNNLTELIKARAARHQLTALKYSADWTNLDLFLLGRQARLELKKAQQKSIQDQVDLLTMLDAIYDYPGFKTALLNLQNVVKQHTDSSGMTDWNHPDVVAASRALLKAKNQYLINYYKTKIAKSGTKLTYKDNTSKYLYKVSRDIVEHFRKMSRMTDDSRVRTLPKTIKLNSSPKKKLQLGGTAPFTIYRPLGPTGETSFTNTNDLGGSSSKSSSSSKDTAAKDKLDMIKELFKSVKGLPIDVTNVYLRMVGVLNKAKALGEEMSTDDIAAMYLNSMNDLARLQYSQEAYKDARSVAVSNDALSETAVGTNGELILLDLETGKIKVGTISELKNSDGKLNALTNELALTLRAHSPNLAFDDRIFDIVSNGVGMTKIANHIKSLAGNIGSMETKIEGITQVESNKVKAGLKELAEAPDGYYKITKDIKDSSANVKAALNYIYGILPKNYRTILEMNSNGLGLELIANMLSSLTDDFVKQDITPLTGKASDKTKSGGSSDELEMNNALRLLTGAGGSHLLTFGIGNNNVIQAYGRQATIADTTSNESAFGADFSYSDIYKSGVGRILDLDNASFGDVPINKAMKDSIIVDNSKIVGIDLPYRTTLDGRIVPDFAMLKKVEEADLEVLNQNLDPNKESDINKINQIYASKGLPVKYGGPTQLTGNYMRFAVVQATASEDAFLTKDGLSSNGTLTLVTDDNEIEKYVRLMLGITKDKKYSLDKPGIFSWGNKDVYKGSIFIPITGDITDAALSGGGSKIKTGMTLDYDTMNRTWYTRNYVAPQETNFNK